MGKQKQKKRSSSEVQLRRLNRSLIRIAVVLFIAVAAYEFFVRPQFSFQRLFLLCVAAVVGLLVGRTLGKFLFINRQ
jgi:hypothetical protein